jgi:3-(3-hydroxy-phenyl)propionate hydroxylase
MNHSAEINADVIVVGLGPVGAVMANMLGRYGLRVLVIDQGSEIYKLPRAISFDHDALRILQSAGVQDGEFATVAIPQVQYHSPMFGRFIRMNTAKKIDDHPMIVTFYQPEFEALMRKKLTDLPNVDIRLNTTLKGIQDDGEVVHASVQTENQSWQTVRARFLIGTDGASSAVRNFLNIEFAGQSYSQDWLIVDATRVSMPIDHIEFLCDPQRPTPHMVAPGGRQRWEFMLQPSETREMMESKDNIRKLLSKWDRLENIEIERTAVYRFHALLAASFSKGRCFLAGDAAHVTPPFAGQGLVTGLRDVANLSWKMAWVTRGHAKAEILSSYSEERRPHAKKIINLARNLGSVIMPSNRVKAFFIHGLIRAIRMLPAGRAFFDDVKIKPENTFSQGLFARRSGSVYLRPGSSFPQYMVRQIPNGQVIRSDDLMGPFFSLIGFGSDPLKHLHPNLLLQWQKIGGTVINWCSSEYTKPLDSDSHRIESLGGDGFPGHAPDGWAVIVRPDRCVFTEGPSEFSDELVSEALSLITSKNCRS